MTPPRVQPIPLAYASVSASAFLSRVLLDGDEPGHARALKVLPADKVTRPLRRDEGHVDFGRRDDLAVVDREAVAEQDQVPGRDPVGDTGLPHLLVQLIRGEDHHDVALARGVRRIGDPEALRLGARDTR